MNAGQRSTGTTEDKIRGLFSQVPNKHKLLVLQKLKERPRNDDKLEYLKGWFRKCTRQS